MPAWPPAATPALKRPLASNNTQERHPTKRTALADLSNTIPAPIPSAYVSFPNPIPALMGIATKAPTSPSDDSHSLTNPLFERRGKDPSQGKIPFPAIKLPDQPREGASPETLEAYATGYREIAEVAQRRANSFALRARNMMMTKMKKLKEENKKLRNVLSHQPDDSD